MRNPPTTNDPLVRLLSHDDTHHTRLTTENVGGLLTENQESLASFTHEIQAIAELFHADYSIMPIQCRNGIRSLERLRKRNRQLQELLDNPTELPLIFTALRYRLLFLIHRIEQQAQQNITFLESYRATCTTSTLSSSSPQRRKQIFHSLDTLIATLSELSTQIDFIQHEAHFHQKKLSPHTQSTE